MRLLSFITDLGDIAVSGPVALMIAYWCWRRLDRMLAVSFLALVVLTVAATAFLKIFARHFNPELWETGLLHLSTGAPSGHATFSFLIYGFGAWLFGRYAKGAERALGLMASLGAIFIVLVTRVILHKHTIADVAAGVSLASVPLTLIIKIDQVRSSKFTGPGWELLALGAGAALGALIIGVRFPSTSVL